MYTRMATMVAEQGEIISRIDDDMDIAYAATHIVVFLIHLHALCKQCTF